MLCVAVLTLLFNVVYFNIVGIYFHTKFKYKLFALRDRLRRLRIDNPEMDEEIYNVVELCINGSIGLVSHLSVRNIVIAAFTSSINREDKDKVREMNRALDKIHQNQNLGAWWSQVYQIEEERSRIWKQIIRFNSPFIRLGKPLMVFRPLVTSIMDTYNRCTTEAVPVMMIHAASSTVASALIR
jgi:hypothetical protein